MKTIKDFMNVNEARVDWRNVHDAVLNVLLKYSSKPGVSNDVKDYCNNVREMLETVKH